jgi:hypothetical protein
MDTTVKHVVSLIKNNNYSNLPLFHAWLILFSDASQLAFIKLICVPLKHATVAQTFNHVGCLCKNIYNKFNEEFKEKFSLSDFKQHVNRESNHLSQHTACSKIDLIKVYVKNKNF